MRVPWEIGRHSSMKHTHLLAGALAVATLAAHLWAHSANEPAPKTDSGWKQRQETLNQRAAEAGSKAQVLFIGDSITQGWEGAGKEVWAKYYAHRNAVNLGIGGDRTQHVLWRLENGNLKGLKPKAAVVMIGTNNSNGEDNTVEQIAAGVGAIVQKLRSALPETTVLLVPIFPRGENPNPQRGKIQQVNQILQKWVDGQKVQWVDFGHKFITAEGVIPGSLMPDFLHLSEAGYQIWAESLEPHLAAVLGDSALRTASGSTGAASLSGEWTLTMPGPSSDPVDLALTLKQEGNRLTGSVPRVGGGVLELVDGKLEGTKFSWVIHRTREGGGKMSYRMSGEVKDGQMKGKTETEMDGNPISNEWTAKRK
jgi:lysophospholipase L1-like esterase